MPMSENERIEAAKLVVIYGMPKSQVAKKFNTSPRSIDRACAKYSHKVLVEFDNENGETPEESESYSEFDYHITPKVLTIWKNGNPTTINRGKSSEVEQIVLDCINGEVDYDWVWTNYDPESRVKRLSPLIEVQHGEVFIAERRIEGPLADRLIKIAYSSEENAQNIINFTHDLYMNPSKRAIDGVYRFIEAENIEINEEGRIVAYKGVRADYKDCWTGKIDNSVGQLVKEDRSLVEDDPHLTCAQGLHACSLEYFSSWKADRYVKVLIWPSDVVSVPIDYYKSYNGSKKVQAKIRVCEYFVDEDVTEEVKSKIGRWSIE